MASSLHKASDYQYGYDGMTPGRMLEKMESGWRSSETPCGRGSELAMTTEIRGWLPALVDDYDIGWIADCGAGDLNWALHLKWLRLPPVYAAYDLVPRHPDVHQFDVTTEVLPFDYHLIICRHVLNHLSPKLALDAMDNFVKSGSRYLLLTNCDNQKEYWDACGIRLSAPVERWNDATKWWAELHEIDELYWVKRPC